MIFKDDRTEEEKKTHRLGVRATDNFMSYWCKAEGGLSQVIWACEFEAHRTALYYWVKKREEMYDVKAIKIPLSGAICVNAQVMHLHIYRVTESHPAITDYRGLS